MKIQRIIILIMSGCVALTSIARTQQPVRSALKELSNELLSVSKLISEARSEGDYELDSAGTCNGRLTLESGVPVSSSDQASKSTLYFTPYLGSIIAVYDGTKWLFKMLSEISLNLSGLTDAKNYDVFIYNNAGTLTLELSAAWSSDTARTDTLTLQDGVNVKSGAVTRRWLGTIRTTSTTTTEDSALKRFVWNNCNQRPRSLLVTESTNTWTYGSATVRAVNGSNSNRVQYVSGSADTLVEARVLGIGGAGGFNVNFTNGIGVDSTSADSSLWGGGTGYDSNNGGTQCSGAYIGYPGLGFHYLQWVEYTSGVNTTTFYGLSAPYGRQTGLIATIRG